MFTPPVWTSLIVLALSISFVAPRVWNRPKLSEKIEIHGQLFPSDFKWGTSEDAYQHEGGNTNSDWYLWEKSSPFKDSSTSGACVDFYNRYEEDFQRAAADHQNFHRIGFEWARIEPIHGHYNESAFEHYKEMLKSLKSKNFTVAVNLFHFTMPIWADWSNDTTMDRWKAYVAECGKRFGDLVDFWSTMIDSQIYVLRGYFIGDIPPLKQNQTLGIEIFERLCEAHASAYRILKKYHGSIGMIYFFSLAESAGNLLDNFVHKQWDDLFNWAMLDALYGGHLKVGVFGGPRIDKVREDLKGTLDWIGINYYYREIVKFAPFSKGFVERGVAAGAELTESGWEIYPQGIYILSKKVIERYRGLEFMIAENGLSDEEDKKRPMFIVSHLAWLHKLINDGYPMIGYSYWSGTDNLEWTEGFKPKFGLYSVDMKTFQRHERGSARLYRFIAKNNRLPMKEEISRILESTSL